MKILDLMQFYQMISSKTIINSLLVVLIISGIVLMIFITIPYFFENPETRFLLSKISVQHKSIWQMGFKIHVWSSIFVLIFGFLQFLNPIRIKYPKIHRLLGKLYVGLVLLVSGPGGMIMGFYGNGGLYAKISFVSVTGEVKVLKEKTVLKAGEIIDSSVMSIAKLKSYWTNINLDHATTFKDII
jgi:uncharacterized membrane protein